MIRFWWTIRRLCYQTATKFHEYGPRWTWRLGHSIAVLGCHAEEKAEDIASARGGLFVTQNGDVFGVTDSLDPGDWKLKRL